MRMLALAAALVVPEAASADPVAETKAFIEAASTSAADRVAAMACPGAVLIRPDNLIASVEDDIANMQRNPRGLPATRDLKLMARRTATATVVNGVQTVSGPHGDGRAFVTAVWLDRPGAAPCLALLQRSAAGDLATAAMWNNEFVASATLNREPNAWLVENVRGVKPGRALDVASGEGRNTVWLAKQGWQATGFDLAGEGLRITQERAKAEGVPVETSFADAFAYDFGNARWNLILFSYAPLRGLEAKAAAGLAPGGLVVVEAFHDSAAPNRAGGGVFYASGELARRFREVGLEIVREEEPVRRADYGGGTVRLVQLVARKPG